MNVLAPGSASPSPRRRLRREAFPEAPPDPSRGIIPFQDLQNAQMLPAPRIAVPTAAPHAAAALELEEACARIEATHISEEACEPAPVEAAVPNDAAGLLSLPVDAVAGVLGFLDADSLASVMCSCTALAVAGADDALWRGLFLARWRWRAPSWAVASATADADSAAREEPEAGWRAAFLARLAEQPAVPRLPERLHTRRALEVGGGSRLRSVAEACLLAGQGDIVLVHPGTYEGTVQLPPGVSLRGVGNRDDILIVTDDAPALTFRAPKSAPPGTVTNVTLWRQASASTPPGQPAGPASGCVAVARGALRVDSCSIVSAGEGVVGEDGALLSVSHCDISTISSGFVGSAGEVACCNVSGAGDEAQGSVFAAVTILSGSVNVVNNRIVGSTAHGLAVLDSGCGLVQGNLIARNVGAGVCVGLAGDPHLDRNVIADNGGQGIAVYSDGLGSFIRCEISGNALHGIDVISTRMGASGPDDEGMNHPLFEACVVHNNERGGVAVHDNATASMRGCQLHSNRGTNVDVYAGGYLALEGSTVTDGVAAGLRVRDPSSRATVVNCAISGNGGDNVEVSSWAEPLLVGCEIESAAGSGVVFTQGGQGTVQSCRVARNGRAGVELGGWGAPLVERCAVAHNREDGVVIEEGARGSVRGTRCYGNAMAGVWVKANAVPQLEDCELEENGMEGLRIGQGRAGCIMLGRSRAQAAGERASLPASPPSSPPRQAVEVEVDF